MPGKDKKSVKRSLWIRALSWREKWEDKEEFLDVIYWMRQLLSLIIGVSWGIIPMQGFVGMLLYLLLNAGIVFLYHTIYQKVDDEDYGGLWELVKEGFMTSFAVFLVSWIIFYTAFHHS